MGVFLCGNENPRLVGDGGLRRRGGGYDLTAVMAECDDDSYVVDLLEQHVGKVNFHIPDTSILVKNQ